MKRFFLSQPWKFPYKSKKLENPYVYEVSIDVVRIFIEADLFQFYPGSIVGPNVVVPIFDLVLFLGTGDCFQA